MDRLELTDTSQIEETVLPSVPPSARLDGFPRAAELAPRCSPRSGQPSTPAIGVVVICLPGDGNWNGQELAGRLAARLRGMDGAEAVRSLSERLEPKPEGKLPIIGAAISQSQAVPVMNPGTRESDTGYLGADDCRTLLTLLFTDIVGSTGMVARLGDGAWRALLAKHNAIVRAQLRAFRGKEIDNAGDGFLATFDRPTRAVRCAESIRAELQALDIAIRAAIHTAECETAGERVSGVAVHAAARMLSIAAPGEIIVSSTVRELVAGSGLEFSDGEWHTLRGLTGRRKLFALKPQSGGGAVA